MNTAYQQLLCQLISLCKVVDYTGEGVTTFGLVLDSLLCSPHQEQSLLHPKQQALHQEKAALAPGCMACASPCGRCDLPQYQELFCGELGGQKAALLVLLVELGRRVAQCGRAQDGARQAIFAGLFLLGENLSQQRLSQLFSQVGDQLLELEQKAL